MQSAPYYSRFLRLRPLWRLSVVLLAAALLVLAYAFFASVSAETTGGGTTITVDTSADLNPGSSTQTCTFTQGALFIAATDGCTLRRALREAAARPQSDRPITIAFNLAADDPNANLAVTGTWTLPISGANALPALRTDSILNINGQVTIDGATQPGGRANAPKIIIATGDRSLEIESTNNIIRNLAFKQGGAIFLKEDGNTVENIWMGLSDDGMSIAFRTPGQPQRMAGGGIHIASNNNIVRNNVLAGAFAKAVDIDGGDNNLVENNRIGTRADGTVPDVPAASQCMRALTLDPANWYGGWGIALSGSNNQIRNNRIAGLHIIQSANDTPPLAIEIFGTNHNVSDNIIGVDSAGKDVGVCGQGIKVAGSGTQIIDNQITRSRAGFEDDEESAILSSDSSPLFGSVTVRGNLVEDGPGNVYRFGPGIPALLRNFNSAHITAINGVTVTGVNGDGSPCPNCLIDFYLDNDDATGEALEHLGSTLANANGDFSFTLAAPLAPGFGIRTSSTTQQAGVIGSYGAGTTARTSTLYMPVTAINAVTISGPTTGVVGSAYNFVITVAPANATVPLGYTINVTNFAPQTIAASTDRSLTGSFTWTTPGVKNINVRVENSAGAVTSTFRITIGASASSSGRVYIPLVQK